MKKILFIHGGTLKQAGTETYMMSVFRNIDRSKYHIDFLVFGEETSFHDLEVLNSGSKIYRFPTKPSKQLFKKIKAIKKDIISEKYDIAHAHMNALNTLTLKYMKKLGITTLISHSHGSKHFVENKLLISYKDHLKRKISSVTPNLLSCSRAAGDFLYENNPYTIINNGVNLETLRFNPIVRDSLRKTLEIDNFLVLGHVGRFNFQKNHDFLVDVFYEVKKISPKSKLVLIGEGELKGNIQNKIHNLGLSQDVLLLGNRNDVPDLLQAMDIFIMPSLFEGLPYALVEAQASSLQCFAADTIDSQAKILESFHFLPLDCPKSWATYIVKNLDLNRDDSSIMLTEAGFNEEENVKALERYYEKVLKTT